MFQRYTRVTGIVKSYLHSFYVDMFCIRLFFLITDGCRDCMFRLVAGHFQSIPDTFYMKFKQTEYDVLGD
jgi:hypothetical protein